MENKQNPYSCQKRKREKNQKIPDIKHRKTRQNPLQ
uniref:Uncharacterized protein n=1 Tax=Rhizophora mucronata TaxID=61149 RepID=A0A2P2QQP4_RHIMU